MTVTISPDDPRSVRALAVLAQAPRWTKGHTRDGRAFFVVPGSKGRIYWTDTRACTCPDARERGVACKHVLAVRMWTLAHKGEAPAATSAPAPATCRVCTAELPAGLVSGLCDACDEAGLMVEGVAAIKAAFGSEAGAVVQTIGGGR